MDINSIIEQIKANTDRTRDYEFAIQISIADYNTITDIKHQIEDALKYRIYITREGLINMHTEPIVSVNFLMKVDEPLVFEED